MLKFLFFVLTNIHTLKYRYDSSFELFVFISTFGKNNQRSMISDALFGNLPQLLRLMHFDVFLISSSRWNVAVSLIPDDIISNENGE